MTTPAQRKLRKMPYHCEQLWALVRVYTEATGSDPKERTEMCYRLGRSASEVYAAVVEEEILGTGWSARSLKDDGWVARRVRVEEIGGAT